MYVPSEGLGLPQQGLHHQQQQGGVRAELQPLRRRSTQNATKLTLKQEQEPRDEDVKDEDEDNDNSSISDGDFDIKPVKSEIINRTSAPNSKKRESSSTPSTSPKKQKLKQKQNVELKKEDSDVGMTESLHRDEEASPSALGSGSDGGSEFCAESDSDDEDEWEEVSVSAMAQENGGEGYDEEQEEEEEISGPWQYNAVEIVFDKPLNDVKNHIAESFSILHENPTREMNALQVLALWWRDVFIVTGPGIRNREYLDIDVVGVEAAIPVSSEECLEQRKNLQRRLLNRSGSTDVCSQLFTGICRALGLKARLVESLQACPFKVTLPKDEFASAVKAEGSSSARRVTPKKGKKKKEEEELDESDTTRGSRVVLMTPHRMPKKPTKLSPTHKSADPPVFWTEVYSISSKKWVTVDPVRGYVNSPLKMHPSTTCTNNVLAYVVAYDEDSFVTDVTRRYTSQWGGVTRKLRVQPAGQDGFDWWMQTLLGLMNPNPRHEEDLEEMELLKAEISERMPTKLGDFNNHPLYALERHLKKYEVLHPKHPILGHIRGEAVYPRSCVKQLKSKENWLKRGRVIKNEEVPVKWVKSHASTIYQMRLRQQLALSGVNKEGKRKSRGEGKSQSSQNIAAEDEDGDDGDDDEGASPNDSAVEAAGLAKEGGDDQVALFGEWQTEAYQPPWVVDGKVPRNQYGRQDIFTPEMVPIGGTHLKGRSIAQVARLLGVDYAEAVIGFEFQSRRSIPVIQGIIVPTESAELVMDAYQEVMHQRDQEVYKRKKVEVLKRWRKMIKGVLMRSRLMDEYGDDVHVDDKDSWVPEDDDEDDEGNYSGGQHGSSNNGHVDHAVKTAATDVQSDGTQDQGRPHDVDHEDSGAGFIID
ncbi:hypothetical protein BGZ58_007877 [Dissophora ornata]|nr:hypothetical protein BGZ58_007877 [Dissophora ornata]